MKDGCLYRLDFPNGKSYIGITKRTAKKRFARHAEFAKCGSEFAAHNAIRKYGAENVSVQTLVVAHWDYLKMLETAAISAFGTKAPHGYNMTNGGDGTIGHTHSVESRAKMSVSHKGVPLPLETKAKMSAASKGKPKSASHAANIGASRKGKKLTVDHRKKISLAHTGKKYSPELCAAIGERSKGRVMNQKTRDALRLANIGKIMSPESIAKQWATRRAKKLTLGQPAEKINPSGRYASAESRAKMSAAHLARMTPEMRAKMSASRLGKKRGPYKMNKSA